MEEEQKGEKRAAYGKELVSQLTKKLTQTYGKSFNERNLWYMRQFYRNWPNMNALRSELIWTHYRLLSKVEKDLHERSNRRELDLKDSLTAGTGSHIHITTV